MLKWLILLVFFSASCQVLGKWQENDFTVKASYGVSSIDQPDLYSQKTTFHQISLHAEKTSLFEGFGLSVSADLKPYLLQQDMLDKDSGVEHNALLEGILFLSANSELSVSYSDKDKLEFFDGRLRNQVLGFTDALTNAQSQSQVNFTLGKDRSFFYLNFNYQKSRGEKSDLATDTSVQDVEQDLVSVDLLWRQSESTLWGTKAEFSDVNRTIGLSSQETKIENFYGSAVTEYLGNSRLSIYLGSTRSNDNSQFSWDVKHETFVSENTQFNVRTYRKFGQSLSNTDTEELISRHSASFKYLPVDYVEAQLSYQIENREREDIKTYKSSELQLSTTFRYQDNWSVTASYSSEQLDNVLTGTDLSQNRLQLSISRTFI